MLGAWTPPSEISGAGGGPFGGGAMGGGEDSAQGE